LRGFGLCDEGGKENINTTEKQIDQLPDRIVGAENDSVIRACAKRIAELDHETARAVEKPGTGTKPRLPPEQRSEHAMRFLSTTWKIWKNADMTLKRTVPRSAF